MLKKVQKRCAFTLSMGCFYSVCHVADTFFLDVIEKYFNTDTLRSANLDPDTVMSFKPDSKEAMLVKRADIACCIDNPDPIIFQRYFKTGKISRRACDAFHKAGEEFKKRWQEYRQ